MTEEYRTMIETLLKERLEGMSDVQIRIITDHFLDLRAKILRGVSTDKLVRDIDRFIHEFSTDIGSLKDKLDQKEKQNWYSEKMRTQLDMF